MAKNYAKSFTEIYKSLSPEEALEFWLKYINDVPEIDEAIKELKAKNSLNLSNIRIVGILNKDCLYSSFFINFPSKKTIIEKEITTKSYTEIANFKEEKETRKNFFTLYSHLNYSEKFEFLKKATFIDKEYSEIPQLSVTSWSSSFFIISYGEGIAKRVIKIEPAKEHISEIINFFDKKKIPFPTTFSCKDSHPSYSSSTEGDASATCTVTPAPAQFEAMAGAGAGAGAGSGVTYSTGDSREAASIYDPSFLDPHSEEQRNYLEAGTISTLEVLMPETRFLDELESAPPPALPASGSATTFMVEDPTKGTTKTNPLVHFK
jgi:hypothetical protein